MKQEHQNSKLIANRGLLLFGALVLAVVGIGFLALGSPGYGESNDKPLKTSVAKSEAASVPVALLEPAEFEARRKQGTVLLNVHIPFEGDIGGTDLSIPFEQIAARSTELPVDKDATLLVYCRTGRMSAIAGKTLVGLGYRNVIDLDGGMIAWTASGRSITTSAETPTATLPTVTSTSLTILAADGDANTVTGTKGGGFTGGDFHSLVADPVTANRLFVGGHQAVSVSTDAGSTWAEVASLANADAMGWSFSGDAVWVSGHPGIVRSSDNTKTVESRNSGLPDTDIHALGGSGSVLYAAGPGVGVLTSVDDGAVWTTSTRSVGQSFFGRILVDPNNVNRIVAADVRNGILVSNDAGVSWKQLAITPASWVSSPDGLDTLYASGVQGATKSSDSGATWSPVVLPASATTVEADPTTPRRLYAGAHDGQRVRVWTSSDDGATWEAS